MLRMHRIWPAEATGLTTVIGRAPASVSPSWHQSSDSECRTTVLGNFLQQPDSTAINMVCFSEVVVDAGVAQFARLLSPCYCVLQLVHVRECSATNLQSRPASSASVLQRLVLTVSGCDIWVYCGPLLRADGSSPNIMRQVWTRHEWDQDEGTCLRA